MPHPRRQPAPDVRLSHYRQVRPERSDVDFLVEFAPGLPDPFDDYFGLKENLEILLGRSVDLVMERAMRNPYFAASAELSAQDVYAA